MTIYEQLEKIHKGEQEPLINLINQFYPLIKKYAILLDYEDAFEDLQMKLIELFRSVDLHSGEYRDDKFFLSYIDKSIYRHFVWLLRGKTDRRKEIPASAFERDVEDDGLFHHIWDKLTASSDDYIEIQFDFLYRTLTKYEAEIIVYHYYQQYSINEIADIYGVSPPVISRAKRNALQKLRKYYTKDV